MARPTIIAVGHGGVARGMLDAAEMIADPQGEVHAFGLQPGQDPAELVAAVREAAAAALARPDGELLVLADLFGGSPANAMAAAFLGEPRVQMVTGLNLPMLLELLAGAGGSAQELAAAAVRAGQQGVVDAGRRLREPAGQGAAS